MPPRDPNVRLQDIVGAIERILDYTLRTLSVPLPPTARPSTRSCAISKTHASRRPRCRFDASTPPAATLHRTVGNLLIPEVFGVSFGRLGPRARPRAGREHAELLERPKAPQLLHPAPTLWTVPVKRPRCRDSGDQTGVSQMQSASGVFVGHASPASSSSSPVSTRARSTSRSIASSIVASAGISRSASIIPSRVMGSGMT